MQDILLVTSSIELTNCIDTDTCISLAAISRVIFPVVMFHDHGEVAERPNAGALKASEGKTSGGSNPSLAAAVIA